jgi:hypothetical protein
MSYQKPSNDRYDHKNIDAQRDNRSNIRSEQRGTQNILRSSNESTSSSYRHSSTTSYSSRQGHSNREDYTIQDKDVNRLADLIGDIDTKTSEKIQQTIRNYKSGIGSKKTSPVPASRSMEVMEVFLINLFAFFSFFSFCLAGYSPES